MNNWILIPGLTKYDNDSKVNFSEFLTLNSYSIWIFMSKLNQLGDISKIYNRNLVK